MKCCRRPGCLIYQPSFLEAPDAPVHRSRTQLKQTICVKMMIATAQRHWLRAHQARPLLPLAARPGSWEVSSHFFVIVPVIYWPHMGKKVDGDCSILSSLILQWPCDKDRRYTDWYDFSHERKPGRKKNPKTTHWNGRPVRTRGTFLLE